MCTHTHTDRHIYIYIYIYIYSVCVWGCVGVWLTLRHYSKSVKNIRLDNEENGCILL